MLTHRRMHDTRGDNLGASRKHRGERERGEAFTLRMAHVNVGKMHTLERIGRWFVRPARMMLSRGSGQAPEKSSLWSWRSCGVWSLRTPLEIVDSVRGGRVAAPGVSVSHGPSAHHRARKSSKCIYSSTAFFLAAPFFFLLPSSFLFPLLSIFILLLSNFF